MKYARDKLTCDLVIFNEEKVGSHIWMKAQINKKLVQDHNFWEIRDGRVVNFLDDSWNQCPKLGEDPRWKTIRESGLREGKTKVWQYWTEKNLGDYRKWSEQEW